MRKTVLLYGLLGGVLIAGLKLIEYRWLVVEHSVEIYGGLVAAVFAASASGSASRSLSIPNPLSPFPRPHPLTHLHKWRGEPL